MGKLFKRGRIWFARVPKRGGGTKRVSTYCTDKRAAEVALAQLEREALDPTVAAANRTTTQEILSDYYLSRARAGRAADSKKFVFQKSKHLVRLLPQYARDIDHARASAYVDARLKEWAVAPVVDEKDVVVREGRQVKRTTVKKELAVLKATLKLAGKNKKWFGDRDAVIPELDDDHEDGERFLTPWELIALASVLPSRRMAIVAYAAATGCDAQAIWRATAADVAPDRSTVQIHGRKRKTRERPAHLPLVEQRALVDWALRHADNREGEGPLFAPWVNMRRDLKLACEKLGIPSCSANDLRRTYGSWLRQAGVAPQLIGASMGHADSRMVERVYGKLPADDVARLLAERVAARDAERALVRVGQTMSSTGTLVGHTPDVSEQFAASGAISGGAATARIRLENAEKRGAQGRNRTADTRIFSPSSDIYEVPDIIGTKRAGVGLRGTLAGSHTPLWSPADIAAYRASEGLPPIPANLTAYAAARSLVGGAT